MDTVLGALRRLHAEGWPALRLVCFFNGDEELDSPGSRSCLAEMAGGAVAALVVEAAVARTPTSWRPWASPTLDGLGPAGGGYHSAAEFMSIPSLYRRVELLAAFLRVFSLAERALG
ncbi:MAG: hypothetical protein K6U03_07050 [Firmicutes bacterium]|nr:hypothetical protein [Bacillota bacterium]